MQTKELAPYIKIGADGAQLPREATEWVAVLDPQTGLMWPADHVIPDRLNFADAQTQAAAITLAGFTDWRAPTIKELLTLPDFSKVDPAIDTEFFRNTKSAFYWSSSVYVGVSGSAWLVLFYGGGTGIHDRNRGAFVRPVRVARQS